jgi:lysozyme
MAVLDPQYVDAIKSIEGYAPTASWDYKQYSSGYGTKAQPGDENIPPDQLKNVYEQRFQDELAQAAAHVDSVNPNLPPGPRAALTSLTYNAGPGWSQSGLGDLVRKGDLEGAAARMQQYNQAGGEVNPGLVARRAKEAAWFSKSPQATPAAPQPAMIAPQSQSAPIFAQAPQAAPQPQQQAYASTPAYVPDTPQQPLNPIFASPRRPVDLSKLRAAFQPPQFYRG